LPNKYVTFLLTVTNFEVWRPRQFGHIKQLHKWLDCVSYKCIFSFFMYFLKGKDIVALHWRRWQSTYPLRQEVDNVEPFLFSGIFNKAKIELFYKNKETFTGDGLKTFSSLSGWRNWHLCP